jgi:hypothetical protein
MTALLTGNNLCPFNDQQSEKQELYQINIDADAGFFRPYSLSQPYRDITRLMGFIQ